MTPVRLRPDLRLPWQALAAFAAALYILESALRHWDFRPSILDGVVFGGLLVILTLRPLVQRLMKADEEESE